MDYFYPRSPCGERRYYGFLRPSRVGNFYPRSPCGERRFRAIQNSKIDNFYPRSPCGERLWCFYAFSLFTFYFYPRSPCGERHQDKVSLPPDQKISIHALLAESDFGQAEEKPYLDKFLSTLSLRRATQGADFGHKMRSHFYPRSPCGERQNSPCRS